MSEFTVVVKPRRGFIRLDVRELWEYRDLFVVLLRRDVSVRYKQTIFGGLWALFQPLALMIVFTVFLGRLAEVPSDGVPYSLFAYCGLLPWTFFAQGLAGAASSLVENERLVTKVYFPRLLMPAAAGGSYVVDFLIGHGILVLLVIHYGVGVRWQLILLPVVGLGVLAATLALGIGLAALNVRFRDVRYAIPFGIQLLLFVTPVVYPVSLIPEGWLYVYALNPMTALVDLTRWAVLDAGHLPAAALLISLGSAIVMLFVSISYFQRVERGFADVI